MTAAMTVRRGPGAQWLLQVGLQNQSQEKLSHPATRTAWSPAGAEANWSSGGTGLAATHCRVTSVPPSCPGDTAGEGCPGSLRELSRTRITKTRLGLWFESDK